VVHPKLVHRLLANRGRRLAPHSSTRSDIETEGRMAGQTQGSEEEGAVFEETVFSYILC
jgi:hypothetical protein